MLQATCCPNVFDAPTVPKAYADCVQKIHKQHKRTQICRCICLYTMLFGCSPNKQVNNKQTKFTKRALLCLLLRTKVAGHCAVRFEACRRFVFVDCMRHLPSYWSSVTQYLHTIHKFSIELVGTILSLFLRVVVILYVCVFVKVLHCVARL